MKVEWRGQVCGGNIHAANIPDSLPLADMVRKHIPKAVRRKRELPPCAKRLGNGNCGAIGCCEVGDMPCECDTCTRPCKKRDALKRKRAKRNGKER